MSALRGAIGTLALAALLALAACGGDSPAVARSRLIPPSIVAFGAEPNTIGHEDAATLAWEVAGGGDPSNGTLTISIEPHVGLVDVRTGSVDVSPTQTTTYTLAAANASGAESSRVTVTVEVDTATSVAPTSTTCDGTPVGADCEVTVSLVDTDGGYEGAQFEFASPAFDLMEATAASETTGCFIEAGSDIVVVACDRTFAAGSVASLRVSRTLASASTFEVANAGVVVDGALESVRGGTLSVAAAD